MMRLPKGVVAEAFALSSARGADLLARLGEFNVWRGDLAQMRGDEPRLAKLEENTESSVPRDALVLAHAIELLQPACRAALSAVYAKNGDADSLANELDTDPENSHRIVSNCEEQLQDIYDSLSETASGSRRR